MMMTMMVVVVVVLLFSVSFFFAKRIRISLCDDNSDISASHGRAGVRGNDDGVP